MREYLIKPEQIIIPQKASSKSINLSDIWYTEKLTKNNKRKRESK